MTGNSTADGPRLRESPEDFVVDEVPLYEPSGEGSHTFLRVEKRMRTTDEVARALARAAGVRAGDVGYAGRKDRMAVTRQWFSVPGLEPGQALGLELAGAKVLEAIAHQHKLRTGQLKANRFSLCVRGVDEQHLERAQRALRTLSQLGMPNRFGEQRFGRDGDNAERGRELLLGKVRAVDRRKARFLVSALQSAVFNRVLEQRPLRLDELEAGDVAMVEASGGLFHVEDVERENARAAAFEISPTGPIFGRKSKEATGRPGEREAAACEALGVPPRSQLQPPRGIRIPGTRRALRVRPVGFEMDCELDVLQLKFELPRGAFATVLVEELGLTPSAVG